MSKWLAREGIFKAKEMIAFGARIGIIIRSQNRNIPIKAEYLELQPYSRFKTDSYDSNI